MGLDVLYDSTKEITHTMEDTALASNFLALGPRQLLEELDLFIG